MTGVRSSRRGDLLNPLVPQRKLPTLEVHLGHVAIYFTDTPQVPDRNWYTVMAMVLYVIPNSSDRVFLSYHLASLNCRFGDEVLVGQNFTASAGEYRIRQMDLEHPRYMRVCTTATRPTNFDPRAPVELSFEAGLPGIALKATASMTLPPKTEWNPP
jgi:hypothetical protein